MASPRTIPTATPDQAPMRLKFDAGLPFQQAAIQAAVGLFAGQPLED